jgi:hypothetical protein
LADDSGLQHPAGNCVVFRGNDVFAYLSTWDGWNNSIAHAGMCVVFSRVCVIFYRIAVLTVTSFVLRDVLRLIYVYVLVILDFLFR